MNSNNVLQQIAKRNPPGFDGRPLFAMAIQDDEFEALQGALSSELAGRSGPLLGSKTGFAVFTSEFLRRSFDGRLWEWKPIWDALDWRGMADKAFYDDLDAAFDRLKIDVLRTHRREWLGTLLCQGGLPTPLLERSFFAEYLSELLRETEARGGASACGAALAQTVAERYYLPQRLQNRLVYELAADLVRDVVELRASLPQAAPPAGHLDADGTLVHWGAALRFGRGEKAAQLRRRLLTQARPAAAGHAESIVRLGVDLVLTLDDGRYSVERQVVLPFSVRERDLVRQFTVSGSLPSRMRIELAPADSERVPVGMVQERSTSGREREFSIERRQLPASARAFRAHGGGAALVLSHPSGDLGAVVGDAGGALLESPLIFPDWNGEGAEVAIARGDVTTRRASVLIVHARETELRGHDVTQVGTVMLDVDTNAADAALVSRVRGSATWTTGGAPDAAGTITLAASVVDGLPVDLAGRRERLLGAETEVWFGLPSIVAQADAVPRVRWEVWARPAWREVTDVDAFVGRRLVRARLDDGRVVFRDHLHVVPRDFRCWFAMRGAEGLLCVSSATLSGVDVLAGGPPADGPELRDGRRSVVVRGDGVGALSLLIRFDGGEVPVSVPSPARAFWFEQRGQRLEPHASIPRSRLHDVRARTVDPTQRPTWLAVRLALHDASVEGLWSRIAPLRAEQAGATELRLSLLCDQLGELIALGHHPEDALELGILDQDGQSTLARLRVVRIEDGLVPSDRGCRVELAEWTRTLPEELRSQIKLEVRPLAHPDRVAPVARDTLAGGWSLGPLDEPSIVVARHAERVRFRPRRVGPNDFDKANRFDAAISHATSEERQASLSAVLNEEGTLGSPVMRAPRNRSTEVGALWARLEPFVWTLSDLPSATFDVVRAIAKNPFWSAYTLLEAAELAEHRDAVWNAFLELPFLWHLVPPRAWIRAMGALHEVTRRANRAHRRTRTLAALRARVPGRCLTVILDLLSVTVPCVDPPSELAIRPRQAPLTEIRTSEWSQWRKHKIGQLAHAAPGLRVLGTNMALPASVTRADNTEWKPAIQRDLEAERRLFTSQDHAASIAMTDELHAERRFFDTPDAVVERAAAWTAGRALTGASATFHELEAVRWARSLDPDRYDLVHAFRLTLGLSRRLQGDPSRYDND